MVSLLNPVTFFGPSLDTPRHKYELGQADACTPPVYSLVINWERGIRRSMQEG
jgi:hypothetical protein